MSLIDLLWKYVLGLNRHEYLTFYSKHDSILDHDVSDKSIY